MEKLKQVLAQEDTVLFIGSGISLWSGLPTWSGMVEELAKFVERCGGKADLIRTEATRGDLLQAASYGADKLTKQQFGEFIRVACRYGTAKPQDIHQKIVSLGPRCFITTNYDDLIEQSLRKWQPDRFYKPPTTNRHLTETAEIVHARAIDFIFKPHGDAGDSDSIILTREQYRQLLPQGERHAALESVKMLLASRPVVYLGFGLRDPDFSYVRDLLANTYKGGIRDHYAIIADVSEGEIDYWRRNYGIHLLSYETVVRPDKSRDHKKLAALLDTLLEKVPPVAVSPAFNPKSPEVLLALARHASALARMHKLTPEFSIRVHSLNRKTKSIWDTHDDFDHSPVESFLDLGPARAVMLGLPGAGKTYALRRAAARLAEHLNQACMAEAFVHSETVVPIFVDLKLYRGDLSQLASQTLPSSLPLHELTRAFKVKVFLDSFNEMPREYWETGSYESDFQAFIRSLGQVSVVIGSRTTDGLAKLEFPVYCLDEIDRETVTKELHRLGFTIDGRFSDETLRLLQRPFYFQYVASGEITLPSESHPRDFYRCFFDNMHEAFFSRFGHQLNLEGTLAIVAYESLNRGEEAFSIAELLSAVEQRLNAIGVVDILPKDIANWLISRLVLLPYSGSRIAFVHQSVTEYLAATELARRYISDPKELKEKLALTRWDQALFLTLSLLPPKYAELFLRDVIQADFTLALNAAKYLETGRDEIIAFLLSEVPKRSRSNAFDHWRVQSIFESGLPVSEVHEQELRGIVECGGEIGGAAVIRLVELKGEQVKGEILDLLLDKRDDYNFCMNGLARALKPFITQEDALTIASWADVVQSEISPDSDDDLTGGFTSGASELLSDLDLTVIRHDFLPSEEVMSIPEIRAQILCGVLKKHYSTAALNFAAELLLRGVKEAAAAICFIAMPGKETSQLSWASFTYEHVKCLQDKSESEYDYWGLKALRYVCRARNDLAAVLERSASHRVGVAKAAFLYCVSPTNLGPVFDSLRDVISLSKENRDREPLSLIKHIELDWSGKAELYVELLKTRDGNLAQALFGDVIPSRNLNLGILEIGEIEWWLEWMLEVNAQNDLRSRWFLEQLGSLFANHLTEQKRNLFVAEFNKENSKYRGVLLRFVIPYFKDLTTDIFSESTISFLLADLNRAGAVASYFEHPLGNAATERFIEERILPLLPKSPPDLKESLRAILDQAGSRLGRRYALE